MFPSLWPVGFFQSVWEGKRKPIKWLYFRLNPKNAKKVLFQAVHSFTYFEDICQKQTKSCSFLRIIYRFRKNTAVFLLLLVFHTAGTCDWENSCALYIWFSVFITEHIFLFLSMLCSVMMGCWLWLHWQISCRKTSRILVAIHARKNNGQIYILRESGKEIHLAPKGCNEFPLPTSWWNCSETKTSAKFLIFKVTSLCLHNSDGTP